ncbi:uncharacterized protein [Cicer arietinum]|uniref:Abnormal spindle-like microcephaly-associated protein homolog isoform X2 n=1 Tax=Cicer arietinum TaxID=3827 RepID=A0A1S2YNY6_CICAR|nr:abnormal spindle-like microcephaly-associated protein homolog isoform X2 [Cicer arietinum]
MNQSMEEDNELPCPSPYPSSSLLKDISNFKTPNRPSSFSLNHQSPFTQYFTASKSKHTTTLLRRPKNSSATAATKKLKAFQLEHSHTSRIAQIKKQQTIKSLAKSLTVWLNFLLESPASCGCDLSIAGVQIADASPAIKGKRDNAPRISVGVDSAWRTPKRQRKLCLSRVGKENASAAELHNSSFSRLKDSLKDVCSFDDLKQRMSVYLSLGICDDIFQVMTHVTKTIDEGRLNLKAHCPMVTDLGLKDKAIKILICYNPNWLRIGLYIIFGGESLVSNGDGDSDQDVIFLKMVIEKLFFTHEGLAKMYAYNKMVEGVYRSGYYENLGNVILKRILLLVLILDKAKCQSFLPIEYGIDGLDGGSPLLFKTESWIKSSSQVIQEFLSSDVMRGEGNLLTHLVILGYKVSHQQGLLVEYDFQIRDLFTDLQDGLKLCRVIHLLQHNSSILKKIVVPSDTRKKNLANCGVALQYLRQAGVSLIDEEDTMIVTEDIINGDKELTVSLLWNMFVHLQLPLLVDKTSLVGEISKIQGLGTDLISGAHSSSLELLLKWIQAVCDNYNCRVDSFHSLVDGKAIWCLLDYYFQKELHNEVYEKSHKASIMSVNEYSDALYNFILSQKLTTLLGNFPEVLQISELLQYNGACSDRSVVILVVFLASQLFVKKKVDHLNFHKLLDYDYHTTNRRNLKTVQCHSSSESTQNPYASDACNNEDAARKFKAIQTWWQEMADRNCTMQPAVSTLQISRTTECHIDIKRENAARTIQSHIRGLVVRRKFLKMVNAVTLLKTVVRAWLKMRQESVCMIFTGGQISDFSCDTEMLKQSEIYERYAVFFYHRHSFLRLKRSAQLIQQAVRSWLCWRPQQGCSITPKLTSSDMVTAATTVQKFIRGWLVKRDFLFQRDAVVKIQSVSRSLKYQKTLICQKDAALEIQRLIRGHLTRNRLLGSASKLRATITVSCISRPVGLRSFQLEAFMSTVVKLQRWWKGRMLVKLMIKSAIIIQSCTRGWIARRKATVEKRHIVAMEDHKCQEYAALQLQCYIRGHLTRNWILGSASKLHAVAAECISKPAGCCSLQLELFLSQVVKLQRWWKHFLLHKLMTKSALIIQSHAREWVARRKAIVYRHRIIVIQSHWKGYVARKKTTEQLMDLRLRMQESSKNVDDSKRLINRLLAALSELLNMKSLSDILHTCSTLDMATEHSQRCCEELVSAGAIDTLLRLIRSISRSIPDQEVLKHVLSTLRNLARYPNLLEVLIQRQGSVQTIVLELLRNKEEGFFIASQLLKKICSTHKGVDAILKSPALLKRLHGLVEELTRKATYQKRKVRGPTPSPVVIVKENTDRRLKEAVEILKLVTHA